MMLGLLPPSSSVTRLLVSAAIFLTWRPTSVEPVNEILSTSGCRTSAAPAVDPPPQTTLNAPGGTPASSAISAKSRAVSGVSEAGFRTTVHPAASAGANFQLAMLSGKFHGTIAPTTPIGSRRVYVKNGPSTGSVSPTILSAHPA